jgi:drug/metabolite transporter (DMT)-like permease
MPLWFLLTISSVLLLGIFNVLTKRILNENHDPVVYGGLMQLSVGLLAIIPALISGFTFIPTPENILILVLVGAVYTAGATLFYTGLAKIDMSESAIIDASGGLWGICIGFLILHEAITFEKLMAILLIGCGVAIVSFERGSKKTSGNGRWLVLASTVLYALGAMLDKKLTGSSTPISYVVCSFCTAGSTMVLVHHRRVARFFAQDKAVLFTFIRKTILNAVLILVVYVLQFSAYTSGGEGSKVFAVAQAQSVVTAIFGIVLLNERKRIGYKLLGAAIVCVGLLRIS